LPWVYFPYLVHVIGPDRFGEIALATAIVQYIIYIVDYGYNFTAPRSIALLRGQPGKINEYVSAMFINRLLLFCFSIFILSVCTIIGLIPKNLIGLVLITTAGVLGYIFMPMFLFQGFEKMDQFSVILIGSKIATAISIFIFIRVPHDYILYVCILTGTQLVGGVLSFKLLVSSFEIHYVSVRYMQIKEHLRNGLSIVLSVGTINVFSASTTLILSMFASNSIVGSYAAGEKVIRAIQSLLAPIYRTLQPHAAKLSVASKKQAYLFIIRAIGTVLPGMIVCGALLYFGADIITRILFSISFVQTPQTIRILSVVPIIAGVSSILMNVFLLGWGFNALWSKIMSFTGCAGIIISFILAGYFGLQHKGIAMSIVFVETCILIMSGIKFYNVMQNEK
jgi:PST family polysaccharide transporter